MLRGRCEALLVAGGALEKGVEGCMVGVRRRTFAGLIPYPALAWCSFVAPRCACIACPGVSVAVSCALVEHKTLRVCYGATQPMVIPSFFVLHW